LTFEEFNARLSQTVYVSATPAEYELSRSAGVVVEQVIRPTGLVDPPMEIRPAQGQVDDIQNEIQKRAAKKERVLVTALTKRMAEDLTEYLSEKGVRCRYLHSDIKTIARVELLRDLRAGEYDALIGINLLREGLDLPEVSLVAILDADKEGFLRSARSLIQTCGRAARNVGGQVILYAEKTTAAMLEAINETNRRREKQLAYNKKRRITPTTILKNLEGLSGVIAGADYVTPPKKSEILDFQTPYEDLPRIVNDLKKKMFKAANELDFEKAAQLRDRIRQLDAVALAVG
jgi:excinuclease ABC subunit B